LVSLFFCASAFTIVMQIAMKAINFFKAIIIDL
jgi:hypothetical protein